MSGKYTRVPHGRFRAVYTRTDGTIAHISVTMFDEDWRPVILGSNGIVHADELDKGHVTFVRVEAVPR